MKKHKQKNKRSVPTTETRSGSSSMQVIVALVIVSLCVALGYISYCFVTKSCTSSSVRKLTASQVIIKPPKGEIVAEVVDTPASRELGLSGRTGLKKDEGMLFIFDKPGKYGFWMKDMLFSIDMVWVSEDGLVVNVERNVTPESYPKAFINTIDAKYVLEVDKGSAATYGMYIGSKVEIQK
jgi:uncharacterized membrane protein (UPF0127 family)